MAGHSKWSKIKRKKGVTDQKRGKIFTRCIHEITVAVREGGGGDPEANARLRLGIDKAKSLNVPNDVIDRAIKRATGEDKSEDQTAELTYEGYGPGGTAVLLEVVTDNKNRTVGEIRHAFSRGGGSLGANGCVAWMFESKGLITIKKEFITEEDIYDLVLEAGADDISDEGDVWEVVCEANSFQAVQELLAKRGELDLAEMQMLPTSRIELRGNEAEQMMRLLELLEDLDDVMNVFANCDFPEEEGDSA